MNSNDETNLVSIIGMRLSRCGACVFGAGMTGTDSGTGFLAATAAETKSGEPMTVTDGATSPSVVATAVDVDGMIESCVSMGSAGSVPVRLLSITTVLKFSGFDSIWQCQ